MFHSDAEKILWTQLNEQDDAEKALSAEQAKADRDLPRSLKNYEAATHRLVASMEKVAKLHSKLIAILNDYKVVTFIRLWLKGCKIRRYIPS